jgi:molybdopterin/thiamine biosynthesis adenylyltransferase
MNFSRNRGFVSSSEQDELSRRKVAVAGVGGDGGLVAEVLARIGVGHFSIADPEAFEAENLNRQNGSSVDNLGRNKATVIAEVIRGINPNAAIDVYAEGVTADNISEFLSGAAVLVDETEFTLPALAVSLARAARAVGIPVVTGFNVGFGCQVMSFAPDGYTLERALGIDEDASLDVVAAADVPFDRWIRRLPSYVTDELVANVAGGTIPAPSVAPGVALVAGFVATEVFKLLLSRGEARVMPSALWVDALDGTFEVFQIDDR